MPSLTSEAAELNITTLHWGYTQNGHRNELSTVVYDNLPLFHEAPEPPQSTSLLLPGYGEKEFSAIRAAHFGAAIGQRLLVAVADPKQVGPSVEELGAYASEFAPRVIGELRQTWKIGQKPVQAIGHSMGGGILGLGLAGAPELFGDLGFCQSFGLDTPARMVAEGNAARLRTFNRRFARVVLGFYSEPSLKARWHAGHDILGELAYDLHNGNRFKSKGILSTTQTIMPAVLEHAAAGNKVVITNGVKDPLVRHGDVCLSEMYTAAELLDQGFGEAAINMVANNLTLAPIPGKHAYLGWRTGLRALASTLKILKDNQMFKSEIAAKAAFLASNPISDGRSS